MNKGTRSWGPAQMDSTGETGPSWTGKGYVKPVKAPMKEIMHNKFQYFKIDCPAGDNIDKRTMGFYYHAYAPIGHDNALYTPMPRNMFEQKGFALILMPGENQLITMFQYMERSSEKIYMALPYFQALFNGTLPQSYGNSVKKGASLKNFKNEEHDMPELPDIMQECDHVLEDVDLDMPMEVPTLLKEEAIKNREERIKNLANQARERIALQVYARYTIPHNHTVVPFRNDYGAICYAFIKGKFNTKQLFEVFKDYWRTGRAKQPGAGSSGFVTRNEKYRLSKPLCIFAQDTAKQRFGSKSIFIFENIIKHICEKDGMSGQLELITNESIPNGYIELATDPFGLYTAYIHENCVHEYMEYLCKPEREEPAAMFGDEDDLQVKLDTDATTTNDQDAGADGNAQTANQGNNAASLLGNQMVVVPTAIDNSARTMPDKTFISRMENLLDDAFHNSGKRANKAGPLKEKLLEGERTSPQKLLEASEAAKLEKLWKQDISSQGPSFASGPIGLSWAKIDGASGTRMDPTKNKAKQKDAMKTSAGLMAVTTLGWEHYELTPTSGRLMKSGCHIAEWLHLCAYSWGGPTQSTKYVQAALTESQSTQNLVFGTSEANSCMTRYEKSWQKLIEHENTLFNHGAGNSGKTKEDRLTGFLYVTRNPTGSKSGDVWVDEKDDDRYKWKRHQDLLANSAQQTSHLLDAAKKFPCIAYSIEYTITLESESKILDRPLATSTTYFYPFSRRFYHRSENLLDRALYQYMVLLALEKEYDTPIKAFTVFSKWFKTLLLPEGLLEKFKPDSSGPVASTGIFGGNSALPQSVNSTTNTLINGLQQLRFPGF